MVVGFLLLVLLGAPALSTLLVPSTPRVGVLAQDVLVKTGPETSESRLATSSSLVHPLSIVGATTPEATLDLLNNSLVQGNYLPPDGIKPDQVAYDRANGLVYVSEGGNDFVSLIDAKTGQVVGTVSLPGIPGDICSDPLNSLVYVAIPSLAVVGVINGTSNSMVMSISVGNLPSGIALDTTDGDLFVTNWYSGNITEINGSSNVVVRSFSGFQDPYGIAYDPDNGYLYFSELYLGNITVVNATSGANVTAVHIGMATYPYGIAYDSSNREIYVTDNYNNTVSIIDATTNLLVDTLIIGYGLNAYPTGVIYDAGNQEIYVTNVGLVNVTVINGSTNLVTNTITVGQFPQDGAYDPVNHAIFVTNYASDNVSVISDRTNTVTRSIAVGIQPYGLSENPQNGTVYASATDANIVAEINSSSPHVVTNLSMGWDPLGGQPFGIAYVPTLGDLFVTHYGDLTSGNYLLDVNGTTGKVNSTIPVGLGPRSVAYDSVNGLLYVANAGSNNLTIYNPRAHVTVGSITTGFGPSAVAVDNATDFIYVTSWSSNETTVIDGGSNTFHAGIPVGGTPTGVVVDPWNGMVYVTNSASDNVSVINGTTDAVVGSVPVGTSPEGIAVDGLNGYLYVANSGSNNVSVIDPSVGQVVATIAVGLEPSQVMADPTTGSVFVTNTLSGTITILHPQPPPRYTVTFRESGLPSSAPWMVSIGGTNQSSNTSTVVYQLANGSYRYSVPSTLGYNASPTSGSVDVKGKAAMVNITFTTVTYAVAFLESGLPHGVPWSVTLNGVLLQSFSSVVQFQEPRGNYSFSITPPVTSQLGTRYSPSPASGNLSVTHLAQNVTVGFRTFFELSIAVLGAPNSSVSPGSGWYANGTKVNLSSQVLSGHEFLGWVGSGTGSYSGPLPAFSTTIRGPVNESAYYRSVYLVTVSEVGLPAGTTWYATLNGSEDHSAGTQINFTLSNGTYSGGVRNLSGYSVSPANFTLSINGADGHLIVTFHALPGNSTPSNQPPWDLYIVLGVVAAMVLVGVGFVLYRKRKNAHSEAPPGEAA